MSERIKGLLSVAAGEQSQGDQEWHAESTRRLYFGHPTDIDAAGMVDVNTKGGAEPTHVRVELWVSPEIAAEVIAHVTGRADLASRVLARAEILRREAERAEMHERPDRAHGDGLQIPASALRLERADDARNEALTEEIKSTGGLEFGTNDEEEVEELRRANERARRKAEIAALKAEQEADDAAEAIEPIEAAS